MVCDCFAVKALSRLAQSDPKLNVASAKKLLQDTWNAREIEFLSADGQGIHGRTLLSNALHSTLRLRAVFELKCEPEEGLSGQCESEKHQTHETKNGEPDHSSVQVTAQDHSQNTDPVLERVISTLDAQERRRDFVWAGFVVKDLLPGLGLESHEAQRWFDRLVDDQIFVLDKRPNPNNPDFPSTAVRLNRDNDAVKRVLNKNGRPSNGFQAVTIRGEPASITLVRERR